MNTSVSVKTIDGAPFGAVVRGVTIDGDVTADVVDALRCALDACLLLVFRGQPSPSDDELLAFASHFGQVPRTGLTEGARPEHNEVLLVSNVVANGRRIGVGDAGYLDWHTDYSFRDAVSQTGFLEAIELPAGGGETVFASTYAVYEALPEPAREALRSHTAIHAMRSRYDDVSEAGASSASHPAVARNPRTGRLAAYVNQLNTKKLIDQSGQSADSLLADLWARIATCPATLAHDWAPGDLVMWDQIGLVHSRRPFDPEQRRIMRQLVTVFDDPSTPWS